MNINATYKIMAKTQTLETDSLALNISFTLLRCSSIWGEVIHVSHSLLVSKHGTIIVKIN